MLKQDFFTHPVTGCLIRKMRIYLVAPASVHEYAFHGTGRCEDMSGFTFPRGFNALSMYQEAMKIATEQLAERGTLVIVIDPDFADWEPDESQMEIVSNHDWRMVMLRVTAMNQNTVCRQFRGNPQISVAEVAPQQLDKFFVVLNEASRTLDRSPYQGNGLVLH